MLFVLLLVAATAHAQLAHFVEGKLTYSGSDPRFSLCLAVLEPLLAVGTQLNDVTVFDCAPGNATSCEKAGNFSLNTSGADGMTMAATDSLLLVGKPSKNIVYIFSCTSPSSCSLDANLTGSGGFGSALAGSGQTVLISAGSAVLVYTCPTSSTCTQGSVLTASDGALSFGASIAISGTIVTVGAPSAGVAGAAYVFSCAAGPQACTAGSVLTPSDGASGNAFGDSVGIIGSLVLVGAPFKKIHIPFQGVVYGFDCTNTSACNQTMEVLPNDTGNSDWFGTSMAVSGNVALIGAPDKQLNGLFYGFAYTFYCPNTTSCIQGSKLAASDGADGDGFGNTVAMRGSTVLVGALYKGAAYAYNCGATGICSCLPGWTGKNCNVRLTTPTPTPTASTAPPTTTGSPTESQPPSTASTVHSSLVVAIVLLTASLATLHLSF